MGRSGITVSPTPMARNVSGKGSTDRRVTEEFARAAETDATRAKRGLSDPKAERIAREARRPIAEHVAEFITGMESKGNDPKHVRSTRTYIADRDRDGLLRQEQNGSRSTDRQWTG
jgi:hypothetical protein